MHRPLVIKGSYKKWLDPFIILDFMAPPVEQYYRFENDRP